jgi:hypothetical protein
VRAASACKRWRRVVADAGFQARFRRLRLVLGHYVYRHGDPVFVPSSPIPSIIHSRQTLFSLDLVPKTDGSWRIADGRGGLLLLRKKRGTTWCRRFNPDIVVCEPRMRRHVAISVLPDMLAGRADLGLFLLDDGGGRSCIGLYNFRVLAVLLTGYRRGVPAACVYSGRDGTWHDVKCEREGNIDVPGTVRSFFFAGRANVVASIGLSPQTEKAPSMPRWFSTRPPRRSRTTEEAAYGSSAAKTACCVPSTW